MPRPRYVLSLSFLTLLALLALALATMRPAPASDAASQTTIEGVFSIFFIDSLDGSAASSEKYYVTTDAGERLQLIINNGALGTNTPGDLNKRRVQATGEAGDLNGQTVFVADAINIVVAPNKLGGAPVGGPTGSQPWLIILC